MAAEESKFTDSIRLGVQALKAILIKGDILGALTIMHQEIGDVFRIPLPIFNPVVLSGPEANHFLLVERRDEVRWRVERDPVVRLLRHGLLVEDGEAHDHLRKLLNKALHKRMLGRYVEAIWQRTDQVTSAWPEDGRVDMLVEMRKIALLIFMDSMFGIDFTEELNPLWSAILRSIDFISPGLWIFWPEMPRPGYQAAMEQMNEFLYRIIRQRREAKELHDDLLSILVQAEGMSDDLIRDQLLTMLIAGHDTSTALLAWAVYLLGAHPETLQEACSEVDQVLGEDKPVLEHASQLTYLNQVINETARMYPPIHIGNRVAAVDMTFREREIPAGTRVMYSIYLTHHDPKLWSEPESFKPERFASGAASHPPYSYVPFGGGPRNCIGMAFARLEVNLVLARLLQGFEVKLLHQQVKPHMGATLEPRPGVIMQVRRRKPR